MQKNSNEAEHLSAKVKHLAENAPVVEYCTGQKDPGKYYKFSPQRRMDRLQLHVKVHIKFGTVSL